MRVFLDTSAFVKRYVREKGSDEVDATLQRAERLAVAILCPIEAISTFARLRREGGIARSQYNDLKTAVFHDLQDAEIIGIAPAVVRQAVRALEDSPLKASDAVHVACAVEWAADLFVTADRQQAKAAVAVGLTTDVL